MLAPDDPDQARDLDDVAPGVRAARTRAGLTQKEVADRMNVPLDTYRRWDQGRNTPGSPALLQLLATVLRCPIDVLYPPGDNPHVATALRTTTPPVDASAVAEMRRADQLSILDLEPLADARGPRRAKPTLAAPCGPDGPTEPAPPHHEPMGGVRDVPAELDIPALLATIDDTAPGARPTGTGGTPNCRTLGLAAALAGAVVLAILALAAFSGPGSRPIAAHTEASVRSDTPARSTVAMTWARTARITAAHERRNERGRTLIRLANLAARRGDLRLADARLDLARERYDTTTGTSSVRRHMNRIRARRTHRRTRRARRARTRARSLERRVARPPMSAAPASAAPSTNLPAAPRRAPARR